MKSSSPSTRRRDAALSYGKSEETERRIFEAAVECLCEGGVRSFTLKSVGDRAGVTRSGVQYYATSTASLLSAVQAYIVDKVWGEDLRKSRELPAGSDRFVQALDFALALPDSKYFIAWNELLAAARTDAGLTEVVLSGARLRERIHDALFQEFHDDAAPEAIDLLRSVDDIVVMVLHASAFVRFGEDDRARIQRALSVLKTMVLDLFARQKGDRPGVG